jgi:putative ABC transport system permease protein
MFSVAYAALLRPLPFSDVDRLVILYLSRSTPREGTVRLRWSMPVIDRVGAELARPVASSTPAAAVFESIATFTSTNISLSGGDQTPEQIDGETVSPNYLATLRVTPIAGRVFAGEHDAVVLIGERLWRRRFNADPSIVGRTLRLNDDPLTVAGVLPASFTGLNGRSDVWIPRALAPRLTYSDYLTTPQHFISVVARLRPGTTLEQANAALATIGPSIADADGPREARWSAMALPIGDARIDPTLRRSVVVLLAAASCVLLIACVNVAGLLLARARTREREMAVRLAIGSSRARLVRQLLPEALVLAVVAAAFGVLLAQWSVDVFARTSPAIIASARNDYGVFSPFAAPRLDFRVLLFTLLVTSATTIACGLTPALQASRPTLVPALKEDVRTGGRHRALGGLVVAEVALAVLLLTASGLLLESFVGMQRLRAGFTPDGVLTFWIRPPNSRYAPADGPAIVERVLARIEQVPGVVSAAVNRATPFMGGARTTVFFPDRPADPRTAPVVGRHYVSADYFRTLGVPLMAGRLLTAADRKGRPPVTVVNETAARRLLAGRESDRQARVVRVGDRIHRSVQSGRSGRHRRRCAVRRRGVGLRELGVQSGFLHLVPSVRVSGHDRPRENGRRHGRDCAGAAGRGRVGRSVDADF